MSLILNIDTSTENASICLAENGLSLYLSFNPDQKEHSSWMHVEINAALKDTGRAISDLQAVAITAGPGSYTGLRVAMASAKGLCYALNIPLIAINTLDAMAFSMQTGKGGFLCPMIDARRMEVFTAVYDHALNPILAPCAMILEDNYFAGYLEKGHIIFSGNGSHKLKNLVDHPNAVFAEIPFNAAILGALSYKKYVKKEFSDLPYSEPIYIKDFYMPGFQG